MWVQVFSNLCKKIVSENKTPCLTLKHNTTKPLILWVTLMWSFQFIKNWELKKHFKRKKSVETITKWAQNKWTLLISTSTPNSLESSWISFSQAAAWRNQPIKCLISTHSINWTLQSTIAQVNPSQWCPGQASIMQCLSSSRLLSSSNNSRAAFSHRLRKNHRALL